MRDGDGGSFRYRKPRSVWSVPYNRWQAKKVCKVPLCTLFTGLELPANKDRVPVQAFHTRWQAIGSPHNLILVQGVR